MLPSRVVRSGIIVGRAIEPTTTVPQCRRMGCFLARAGLEQIAWLNLSVVWRRLPRSTPHQVCVLRVVTLGRYLIFLRWKPSAVEPNPVQMLSSGETRVSIPWSQANNKINDDTTLYTNTRISILGRSSMYIWWSSFRSTINNSNNNNSNIMLTTKRRYRIKWYYTKVVKVWRRGVVLDRRCCAI